MSFPANPLNNDTTQVNGITYIYSSTNNSWKRVTSTVSYLTIGNVLSVTGNIVTTGNIVVSGAGNITVNGSPVVNIATMLAYQLAL